MTSNMNAKLSLLIILAGCSPSRADTPAPPSAIPVRTAAVEHARRTRPIHAVGTLAGKEEVKLSFKVGGIVERVFVDEGATVTAGQRLATLKLPEVNAAVTQARRGLEKAERDLARVRDLYEGKAATLEQLQNATTAVDVAAAAMSGATFNEDHATIRAPAAGKILRRLAEADELVAPGAPVLLLRAAGRGWVLRAGVGDRDVVRVALGDRATLSFDALEGPVKATVSEIAESATPVTGSYELELKVDSVAGVPLRSGLIAHAVIQPAATRSYAFVPVEALQEGDGATASVFVPAGDRVERRPVTVAYLDGDRAAIALGLEDVATVVTDGAHRLTPGAAIRTAEVQP